ncbi:hypothetical protein ZIOFF_015129 [Zingiber officinale]|uniref:Uncharacterized protein n=1 Tax=Zingiber officinale TaxID=94328 RepID=A0A8J5HIC6_ZINOF|nr:hypothetical protein ZIOFF_015129 [Zingiber officinale]
MLSRSRAVDRGDLRRKSREGDARVRARRRKDRESVNVWGARAREEEKTTGEEVVRVGASVGKRRRPPTSHVVALLATCSQQQATLWLAVLASQACIRSHMAYCNIPMQVGSFEDVLKKMEINDKNSGWDDLIFIPPGKSYTQNIKEVVI